MQRAVNHGRRRELIAKDGTPLGVGLVRGDDDAASRVALGDELEKKAGGHSVQGQLSDFVEDDHRRMPQGPQMVGEPMLLDIAGELIQLVRHGNEVDVGAPWRHGLHAEGHGEMRLAHAPRTEEDHVSPCARKRRVPSSWICWRSIQG